MTRDEQGTGGGSPPGSDGTPDGTPEETPEEAPAELPFDGTLDLHMFQPREVRDLVRDYLDECLRRGILEVRIVHGKGTGVLRRIVQGVLRRHPAVTWYGHQEGAGSWGATVVHLRPPSAPPETAGPPQRDGPAEAADPPGEEG